MPGMKETDEPRAMTEAEWRAKRQETIAITFEIHGDRPPAPREHAVCPSCD